ncbi:MAG: ASKHA domain-containing protein [Dehalococcoidales bacterium]|nr:ASKHA domain-containing protein [Dehalococcoidales bacterium]
MSKGSGQVKVVFQPSERRGDIGSGKSIKQAARELGVGIEGLCGDEGTCGKCKVRIEEGISPRYGIESRMENLSPLNKTEKGLLTSRQQRDGYRLACQARIRGDVIISVTEESRLANQVVRKAAREITVELKPAVRKYCVELKPATLDDALGDWERLQAELKKRFKLVNLTIDYQALRSLQKVVRQGSWRITVSLWMGREVIGVEPGVVGNSYGLAVDIGTTTVAAYLCRVSTGDVIATESMVNPQVSYGEDVIARINYAMTCKDGLEVMNRAIIRGINELAGKAAARAGIKRSAIVDMAVVGNTCMHHIFLSIDPGYLGQSPFPPALHRSLDIKARELGLRISPGAYVHFLPVEAGFVGADNVGVLIAEEPYRQDSMVLIIDVGTNGELIMGNRDRLVSASCATGPAFEGAEIRYGMRAAPGAIEKVKIDPETREVRFKVIGKEGWSTDLDEVGASGICGSGIIDAVAQLFLAGVIDRTGRFNTDVGTLRLRKAEGGPEFVIAWAGETSIGQDIVVCQQDVRNIQLAKGAMYAGARLMMRRLGIDKLDKIILAGAFGSCIDKESAAIIGMFPDCAQEEVYAVGNAAGDGARIALLNVDQRVEADRRAREVEYLELTLAPDFDKVFTRAMWFPNVKDSFPHLKHLLPGFEQGAENGMEG